MRNLLKNPATHVFLLGLIVAAAILFAKGPPVTDASKRVVITGADLLQQRAAFMRTWQREPTAEELRGALEKHIRQEVLYREALARGYDRDDLVVRRAMQQKMEFLAASQAMQEPPTEEEIEAFFALRQERYRLPAVVSFSQLYLSADQRGAGVEQAAIDLLARLRSEDPDADALVTLGDPIMLDTSYAGQTERDVAAAFGELFAEALVRLPVGEWQGPVSSGYGLHLVKVTEREESRVPEWREVAMRVINDMEFEAKAAARDQLYQEIAQNYEVYLDNEVREFLESAG
ncbi:MAG: peptidyl-prolyl cis-trans isomerase [Deltaproteobacteria bacterium]|nr:peptidyl-prolyl cis-trans isomerase [Deltaproteobacteria bacterium]